MKKIILVVIFFASWVINPLQALSQYAAADSSLAALVTSSPAVGISVAVVKKNKLVYTHSAGLKNISKQEPLTNDCIFRIASISKSFSATSIMQLYEQGKLSLDQDVSELIGFPVRNPAFPEKIITLRLMLSHLSSINDSQGYFSLDSINPSGSAQFAKC